MQKTNKQTNKQQQQQQKHETPIYFNSNYSTEVKLVPIILDYCLLQFDALNFS